MRNETKIKVAVADDTQIAREGMRTLLGTADDIVVITDDVQNVQEVPNLVLNHEPDILILDLKWFGDKFAGASAIREIRTFNAKTKIIAITAYEDLIDDARSEGADAAVMKDISREGLLKLIRTLAIRDNLFPNSKKPEKKLGNPLLTSRERQVLDLIAIGCRDKDIAKKLSIAESTAKNHVKNILSKLDAENRTQAVNIAKELGLFFDK